MRGTKRCSSLLDADLLRTTIDVQAVDVQAGEGTWFGLT